MADEWLDIVDENLQPIGAGLRSEIHRLGRLHRVCQCWIIGERDAERYVLFQQRHAGKRVHPNTLDITAAGHLRRGETPRDGVREIEEELGVRVRYEDLVYLGVRHETIRASGVVDSEFSDTYLYRDDRPLAEFRLDPAEIAALVAVSLEDGMRLFAGEAPSVPGRGIAATPSGMEPVSRDVTIRDCFPRASTYYLKIFIMAERYFEGRRYLAI